MSTNLSVEERREARRRKILENSENRLAKILNRLDSTGENDDTAEVCKTSRLCLDNNSISSSRLPDIHSSSCIDTEEEKLELLPQKSKENPENPKTYSFEYLRKYFVVLGVLVYFILAKGAHYLPSNSIFIPFITLSVIKLSLVYKYIEPPTSMIIQVLILYGLHPRFLLKLSKVLHILHDFTLDFCVYFFTIVIIHFILETFFSS